MKIYSCANKNKSSILIVANDEQEAGNICLKKRHVRSINNLRITDITNDYISFHSKRGFVMPSSTGQLIQSISGSHAGWFTV